MDDFSESHAYVLIGRRFDVVAIDGHPCSSSWVEFGEDSRVSGKAPVNRFTGSYEIDESAVIPGGFAITRMAGAESAMAAEQAFLRTFAQTLTVTTDDLGTVELRGANGSLRLEPASGDAADDDED